ncbi:dephospho-CoA kinase [Methyloceanibacter methanicus]|uniref:Dephospho-CoA kinase n=1 Tax=Methyloceanibacter methanicus TaxID=1774968 RepID=A0A1E3W5V3_9HYPH|nr:dephospho-CoA kinase [Methyloceanibacter methanicus]ODS01174.1 dephospho-CoA kinase [Methyloceanibacter methanicus]
MLVIGLTGGIGMGKSSAAAHFKEHGVPVFDADAYVHKLYEGEAVPLIEAAFPGTTRAGRVDRGLLAREVAGRPERLKALEAIVHPLVTQAEIDFLCAQEERGAAMAVLEIPLLFETGAETRVDVTVTVSAPEEVQHRRVLEREGMTLQKFEALRARQLGDAERRARADHVLESGSTLENLHGQLDALIESLKLKDGRVMERLRGSRS